MNATQLQSAGINLTIVAWLARHASDVPTILAGAENVISSATLQEKWEAFKSVGDLVITDLADFPGLAPVNPPAPDPVVGPVQATVADVDAALGAIGDGHIINAIVALVTNPQTLALIELILKLAGVAV
ncbi:MAG TPA: hypothetical protein VHD36_08415 [Pirellulales bacterium]|nr:hypothetical protein [Pirellulales bacterium]